MKRIRTLIILLVVLGLLLAGYFIVKNTVKDDSGENTVPAAETYSVSDLTPDDLCSLDLKITESADGETTVKNLSFVLSDDETVWLWKEDTDVPLDNTAFAMIVQALSGATSATKMTDVTQEKLEEYGLANPYIEACFGFTHDRKVTYRVGKKNSFNSLYYFSDAAAPTTVYMVSEDVADTLNLSVASCLKWDEIPEISKSNVNSVSFVRDGKTLTYKYYPTGKEGAYTSSLNWYLSVDGQDEIAVSPDLGEGLLNMASNLAFYDCVQYTGEIGEEYGLSSSAVMTIDYTSVETVEDSQTGASTSISKPAKYVLMLGVQNDDGDYYAKTETSKLIYTVLYSEVLETALSDRSRDVLPAGICYLDVANLNKAKFTAGDKTLSVTVTHNAESDSYADDSGAEFNYDAFTAITDAIAATGADSYADLVEPVASSGNDLVFCAEFEFDSSDVKEAKLEIRNYSENYCRVSFMGRDDQLVTVENAQKLADILADYFK